MTLRHPFGLGRALVGTIVHPRATFRRLVEGGRLDLASAAVGVYGVLYTGTAAVLAVRKRRPVVRPVLPIDEKRYYAWQTLFTIPVVAVSWIALSGVAWATLRATGHRARLRDCATVLGFASSVPWIVGMWVPETTVAAAFPEYWGAPEGSPPVVRWFASSYLYGVTAWVIGLSVVALRAGTGASWARSGLAAMLSVGAATGTQMIAVR
ncbi:YIP1 family protein [Agromyces bauzanensis]